MSCPGTISLMAFLSTCSPGTTELQFAVPSASNVGTCDGADACVCWCAPKPQGTQIRWVASLPGCPVIQSDLTEHRRACVPAPLGEVVQVWYEANGEESPRAQLARVEDFTTPEPDFDTCVSGRTFDYMRAGLFGKLTGGLWRRMRAVLGKCLNEDGLYVEKQ